MLAYSTDPEGESAPIDSLECLQIFDLNGNVLLTSMLELGIFTMEYIVFISLGKLLTVLFS